MSCYTIIQHGQPGLLKQIIFWKGSVFMPFLSSIFYILSGMSLTIVYQSRINNISDISSYWIKRLFRICPLLWFATTAALLLQWAYYLLGKPHAFPDPSTLFLNYTLLFGFFKPEAYIATGAWSIGNELVFYAFFPFIILLQHSYKYTIQLFCFFSLLWALYMAFYVFDPHISLTDQWVSYIHPFNQLYLFAIGLLIGMKAQNNSFLKKWSIYGAIMGCAIFIFLPVTGDTILIVTKWNRVIFSCAASFICIYAYTSNLKFPSFFGDLMSFLGQCCYSIYLLYPIVYPPIMLFGKIMRFSPFLVAIGIAIPSTLILSHYIYHYLEKPMVRLGKLATTTSKN